MMTLKKKLWMKVIENVIFYGNETRYLIKRVFKDGGWTSCPYLPSNLHLYSEDTQNIFQYDKNFCNKLPKQNTRHIFKKFSNMEFYHKKINKVCTGLAKFIVGIHRYFFILGISLVKTHNITS